jgi:predicted CoA-binding protein
MPVLAKDDNLRDLLRTSRVIALVGYSNKPDRDSYRVGKYLEAAGYTVYPVNPMVTEIDGKPSYASLDDVPESIDIVNVFRRPEHLQGVVKDAIQVGAKAVWAQLGVLDEAAAQTAEANGIPIVMNRCIKVDHNRLIG